MKILMFAMGRFGRRYCAIDDGGAGGGGGGAGGGTPPAETPPASTPPASTPPASTPPAATPPAETPPASTPPAETPPAETPPSEESIQSAIGEKAGEKPPAETPPDETPPAIDAETSKIADEDYTKAMVADDETRKLASDEKIELSPELVKGMLPHLKSAGVKPEQAAQLANSLAREQIRAEKARVAERVENIKRMNAEAMKLYPAESDWKLIGAGVEKFFRPGGTMHYTITHSELGSDPEFLALMKYVGERVKADGAQGAASGMGGGTVAVNMAKALGIK